MCSVVTNLVMSLEFQPICCATMLFHFGRTRNVYAATRIILLSSTAGSSTTSGYVAATNAPAKVRRELVETWNGLGNRPSLFPTVELINAACKHELFSIMNFYFFDTLKYLFNCVMVFISCMEISLIFCLCFYLLCRRGNNHFDVLFRRIGPVLFLSKDGKVAVRERRSGRKGVYFPPESESFPFDK